MAYEKQYYLKYPLDYKYIINLLQEKKRSKINIFIDLNSICKGFFKAETVLYEIAEYGEKGEVSGQLLKELRFFMNRLWSIFKRYDPFFVIFYDDGKCLQNKSIMNTYKSGRSASNLIVDHDEKTTEVFRKIRRFYYQKIKEDYTKEDLSFVFYSHDYETDLVPYYCLRHGIFDSSDDSVQNIVLSIDKDLLQNCQFLNVIQCITSFKPNRKLGKYEIHFGNYNNKNAISYIYENFQEGILTAKFIPMILSICGDKSDEIMGISGVGVSKAVKLIEKNSIPWNIDGLRRELKNMPSIIQDNINIIIRNFKLISFEEQIKRLPKEFLSS